MATLDEYRQAGKALYETLHLDTMPVAITYIKDLSEIPEKVMRPSARGEEWSLCQAFTYARRWGWTVAMTGDDNFCVPSTGSHGWEDISPEDLLEHKRRIFRRLIAEKLKPIPGSVEALTDLDSIPLGLATSSSRSEAELMLRILGVKDRFRTIVTSDDVKRSKPEPDSYRLAVRRLGVAPVCCVAIEDSAAGVQSARQAGLTVLAVTNSLPAEKLAAAHEIFASTAEAVGWIKARLG